MTHPKAFRSKSSEGFSLIELIVVVTGLAVLTSIASTALQSVFSDLENDEVQAHLSSLTADCLRTYINLVDTNNVMPSQTSINTNLFDKNSYEENIRNSRKCLQINPKDSASKTHSSMGFGLFYSKVTKFTVKDLPIQELQLS